MKTPEEIKTGAEYCFKGGLCHICPYNTDMFTDVCMTELKNDLRAYYEQLEAAQPKWISVEERLPPRGNAVLVFVNNQNGAWPCVTTDAWDGAWIDNADSEWHIVTHWMPLPEPPKEE